MQMLDTLIDTLHSRYQGPITDAGKRAQTQWTRLMERLDDIASLIDEPNSLDQRIRHNLTVPVAAQDTVPPDDAVNAYRVPQNQEWILELWTVQLPANGAAYIMGEAGQIYLGGSASVRSSFINPMLIIPSGALFYYQATGTFRMYAQWRVSMLSEPRRFKSPSGERGIGVDPRENPGAADQGRHSLMQPTMIGASKIAH